MRRIPLIALIGAAVMAPTFINATPPAQAFTAHYLQGKHVYMFRSGPNEVTLKWGKSTVFHQGNTCSNPTPHVLSVWSTRYAGITTDYAKLRWCGRSRTRGWQV